MARAKESKAGSLARIAAKGNVHRSLLTAVGEVLEERHGKAWCEEVFTEAKRRLAALLADAPPDSAP